MGKKIETSKEVAATVVVEKKPAKAVKAPAKKKVAKKAPASVKKTLFSNDDIALRAYFIAEKRLKAGLPGNPHQDWLEAEKQLRAESTKKPAPKALKKA